MGKNPLLLLGTCVLILMYSVSVVNGTRILFYKNSDYTGLLFQSTSPTKCNNVPGNEVFVSSIKTDTCLIFYSKPHCQPELSWKNLPNDGNNLPTTIGSYHTCNEQEGGSQLNVDITTFYLGTRFQIPFVLQTYKNICICQNIPENVQQRNTWSINNHGNELKAYYEPNCSELKFKALSLRAGHSTDSRNIYNLEKRDPTTNEKHKIQSFGPDPDSIYFKSSCGSGRRLRIEPTTITTTWEPILTSRSLPIPMAIMDFELLQPLNATRYTANILVDDPETNRHNSNSKMFKDETQIRFYAYPNYRGYIFETNSNSKCNNVPKLGDAQWVPTGISSIKTNTCLMLYSDYNCEGRSIQIESEGHANLTNAWESTVTGPETLSLIYQNFQNWKWATKSFHVCSANQHESSLNIDLTEYHGERNTSNTVPEVFKSYRDVCTCQNIPMFIHEKKQWSINNFGNSLVAYFAEDCESTEYDPLWIPAGQSSFSIGFGSFSKTELATGLVHKIKSFGPDKNSQYFRNNCVKLYSAIIKFEILEPQNGAANQLNYKERNIEMTASETVFRNLGPAQLSQSYTASQLVREAFQLEIGTSLSKMESVRVDSSFDVDMKSGRSGSESHSTGNHKDWGTANSHSKGNSKGWVKSESESSGTHQSHGTSDSQSYGRNQQLGKSESSSTGSNRGYGNSLTNSKGKHMELGYTDSKSTGSNVQYVNSKTDSTGSHSGFSDTDSTSTGSHSGYVNSRTDTKGTHSEFGNTNSNSVGSHMGFADSKTDSKGTHSGFTNSNSISEGSHQNHGTSESHSTGSNTGYSNSKSSSSSLSIGSQTSVGASASFMGFGGSASHSVSLNSNIGQEMSSSHSGGSHVGKETSLSKSSGNSKGYEQSSSQSGGINVGEESTSSVSGGYNMGYEQSLSHTRGSNVGHEKSTSVSGGSNRGHEHTLSFTGGSNVGREISRSDSGGSNVGHEKSSSVSGGSNVGQETTLSITGGINHGHETSSSISSGNNFGKERTSTISGGSSTGSEKSISVTGDSSVGYEQSSSLSEGNSIGSESSTSFFREASFREGLRKAYERSDTGTTSQSNSTTVEKSRTFSATQMITVPSCSEHIVHAYVKMVTNKRIEYRAVTKISGRLGKTDMTAAEVYEFMDKGLGYIRDYDEYTVLAYSKGYMKAEYGISSYISAEGSIIHECVATNRLCPVCETCTNHAATCPEVPSCSQQSEGYET